MGRLIKNHWARLIILTAATYQIAASLHAYIYPKILFDFLSHNLDGAVLPIPYLQTLNLILGLLCLGLEYPFPWLRFPGSVAHRSIEVRLVLWPLAALASVLLYQGANAAVYYFVGELVWGWAYAEGEVVCKEPWSLAGKDARGGRNGAQRV